MMKISLFTIVLLLTAMTLSCYADAPQTGTSHKLLAGPALRLDYDPDSIPTNPVDCFMYFVPLTSPTSVLVKTDPGSTFRASITSWETKQRGKKVRVECDFEVTGQGDYRAIYIAEEMIRHSLRGKNKTKEITRLLEWIQLDGPCLGRIEGYGKVVNGQIQMESVEVCFTRNNSKSPVQVSIYDIPRINGEFLFENRTNCQVARVNALRFKCEDDETPRMSVEIATLTKAEEKEGIFSRLTAMIANILMTSTPVAPVGNSTMMDFGVALYEKDPVFRFPVAVNLASEL